MAVLRATQATARLREEGRDGCLAGLQVQQLFCSHSPTIPEQQLKELNQKIDSALQVGRVCRAEKLPQRPLSLNTLATILEKGTFPVTLEKRRALIQLSLNRLFQVSNGVCPQRVPSAGVLLRIESLATPVTPNEQCF